MQVQDAPLFICKFEGGHEACAVVFCSPAALDPARGVVLAQRAYRRLYHGAYIDLAGNEELPASERDKYRKPAASQPPAIVHARFELNGEVDNPYGAAAPLPLVGTAESARPDVPADDGFSRWLADNPPPDLQELVERYDGYSKVPPEAWADFERAKVVWEVKRKARLRRWPPTGDALATPDQPSPQPSPREACIVCGVEACFGYRNRDRMEWFCVEHRRTQAWADARR
jgi:hypothetical protein